MTVKYSQQGSLQRVIVQSAAWLTSAVIAAKLPDRSLRVFQVVPGYLAAAEGSANLNSNECRHMVSTLYGTYFTLPQVFPAANLNSNECRHMVSTLYGTYFTLPQVFPAADAQEARLWAPAQVDYNLKQNTY